MQTITAPEPLPEILPEKTLFLAGSIEMDTAEEWQERVKKLMADSDWTILNPRRAQWDSSWKQVKENPQFRAQVEWELSALEKAHKALVYFDPNTKSPITLLELGLFGRQQNKMIVVCPPGFWRKGNIDIVCERYGIKQAETIEAAITEIRKNLEKI